MARAVEHQLEEILGNAKGGGKVEGAKELKLLKDRNRLLLDVSGLLSFYRSTPLTNSIPFFFPIRFGRKYIFP